MKSAETILFRVIKIICNRINFMFIDDSFSLYIRNVVTYIFPVLIYKEKNILTCFVKEIIELISIKFRFDLNNKQKYFRILSSIYI